MQDSRFVDLYQKHFQTSFRFVKSYVRDDLVSEDIVSESLIELWQAMKKEEVISPLPLLVTILRNKSLNYLKHLSVRENAIEKLSQKMQSDLSYRLTSLEACDPQELFSTEITEIIEQTLNALPQQTRRIFQMSRNENLSTKKIAEELNISTKGVEYHMTKALKELRISLQEYLPLLSFLTLF